MSALQALLLSAGLAGMDAVPVPPPATPVAASPAEQPRHLVSVPLAEIAAAAAAAEQTRPAGHGSIAFSAGLDPRANTWIKFRQEGRLIARSESDLTQGVRVSLPLGTYRFSVKADLLEAAPVDAPGTPSASLSISGLLLAAYTAAPHAAIAPLKYAMLYEDGSLIPASICLLRKDDNGILWATYAKVSELQRMQWFVAVNGVMYGMRIEGGALAFYAQPAAQNWSTRIPERRLW